MKKKSNEKVNNILSFFGFLIISGLFTYFLSGKDGLTLSIAMLTALFLSVVNIAAVRKKITVDLKIDRDSLCVGDVLDANLTIKKTTKIPTPFIEVGFKPTDALSPCEFSKVRLALFYQTSKTTAVSFDVKYSGKTRLEVEYIKLFDYLGMFSHTIYDSSKGEESRFKADFKIMPKIAETSPESSLLKQSAISAASYQDDEEQSVDSNTIGMGQAGFDYRPYCQGDPVKRINWKLSMRAGQKFVRLDEKPLSSGQVMVIELSDPEARQEQTALALDMRERLCEAALALLSVMVRQGTSCQVYVYAGGWEAVEVSEPADITNVRELLSFSERLYKTSEIMPAEQLSQKGAAVTVFTQNPNIAEICSSLSLICDLYYVFPSDVPPMFHQNVWLVDGFYEFNAF